jgi:hypothetical protein
LSVRPPLAARGLAILAAACLVGAFALALFFPPETTLQRLVIEIDQAALLSVQDWVGEHWGAWVWANLFEAPLARPAWLLALSAGVILGGLAVTVGMARRVPGSPRWRN